MSLIEKVTSFLTGGERKSEPVGTIYVVDPSPLRNGHEMTSLFARLGGVRKMRSKG